MQNVKVTVEGNGDAATAAPGSGIIVLSDPFRTCPRNNRHSSTFGHAAHVGKLSHFGQPWIEVNQIATA
jgi:hypothetical protein